MTKTHNQWTLGQLLDALRRCNPTSCVIFDFCYFRPDGLRSYKGFYEDAALGYSDGYGGDDLTVEALVVALEGKLGKTMEGYKGGTYRITRDTALWVSNYGEARGTTVVGLEEDASRAVILTDFERW